MNHHVLIQVHLLLWPCHSTLSDEVNGRVASSVTWQSNKSVAIKSKKTVGDDVLHSLAAGFEGGLFFSVDLHFVKWLLVSSTFCIARHPRTCVAREQCRPPLVNTGKACKWNNLDSRQGAAFCTEWQFLWDKTRVTLKNLMQAQRVLCVGWMVNKKKGVLNENGSAHFSS